MIDLKVNFKKKYRMDLRFPFCNDWDETLEHIFVCDSWLNFPKILQNFNMACISGDFSHKKSQEYGGILRQIFLIPRRTAKLKEGCIFHSFIFVSVFYCKKRL